MPNGPWTAYSGGFQNGITLAITPKNVVLRDNSLKPLLQCTNYIFFGFSSIIINHTMFSIDLNPDVEVQNKNKRLTLRSHEAKTLEKSLFSDSLN